MQLEIVTHLRVGLDDAADALRGYATFLVDGRRGHESLGFEMIRVGQVAHHRHRVVRLVLDVGEDDDAGFVRQCGAAHEGDAGGKQEQALEFHGFEDRQRSRRAAKSMKDSSRHWLNVRILGATLSVARTG
jgi:hypothetical protein